jgi:cytochrome c-type biogenesis protein CcmH/NrfG
MQEPLAAWWACCGVLLAAQLSASPPEQTRRIKTLLRLPLRLHHNNFKLEELRLCSWAFAAQSADAGACWGVLLASLPPDLTTGASVG